MYGPQIHTHQNPRYVQGSPYLRPHNNFSPRNFKMNRFRPSTPSEVQNNYEFWCETCDKGFISQQILENHKSQHQKCNIDGCQFVAHPKIITKHIQMQHSTGLYKKIANLNNPEEIRKWREERKRKFPTKQNIEKKAAEIKEKLERGEKMGIFESRKKRGNPELHAKSRRDFSKKNCMSRQNNNKFRNKNIHKQLSTKMHTVPSTTEPIKLNPFAGIQHMQIEENIEECYKSNEKSLIEDDIFNEESPNLSKSEPSMCEALTSLICNYGSSDEESQENSTVLKSNNTSSNLKPQCIEEQVIKDKSSVRTIPVTISNIDKSDDDSGPEEAVINKIPTETINTKDDTKCIKPKTEKRVRKTYTNTNQFKKPKHQLPSTLLVKLLSREIEHERNIILQCVRYVVKNNYFDNSNDNK